MPNDRRRTDRGLLNYYAPLAFTVTVAVIGIAAWVWKERNDNEEQEEGWDGRGDHPPPAPDYNSNLPPGHTAYAPGAVLPQQTPTDDPNMLARMQGALRRTPSPQQLLDGASRKVAAGVAAAGAMVGGALSSIREEDARHFEDHSRWSEEAEARRQEQTQLNSQTTTLSAQQQFPQHGAAASRKAVAIVLSAEAAQQEIDQGTFHTEHASILSHLPEHVGSESRIFIMIYAPDLKQHPLSVSTRLAPSVASSFSHIDHGELNTPGEEQDRPLTNLDPAPIQSAFPASEPEGSNDVLKALYQQARTLVEREAMIMPFATVTGYVHLVKHLRPRTVYVQSSLAGTNGEAVKDLSAWVPEVVLVVGDETGHGGLVDSEDERVGEEARERWWQDDPAIGLGKGIDVVEGLRIGEDWRRRVKGHD